MAQAAKTAPVAPEAKQGPAAGNQAEPDAQPKGQAAKAEAPRTADVMMRELMAALASFMETLPPQPEPCDKYRRIVAKRANELQSLFEA